MMPRQTREEGGTTTTTTTKKDNDETNRNEDNETDYSDNDNCNNNNYLESSRIVREKRRLPKTFLNGGPLPRVWSWVKKKHGRSGWL